MCSVKYGVLEGSWFDCNEIEDVIIIVTGNSSKRIEDEPIRKFGVCRIMSHRAMVEGCWMGASGLTSLVARCLVSGVCLGTEPA